MDEDVKAIVARVGDEVRNRYVFPDQGAAASAALAANLDSYPADLAVLAERLTDDLRAVCPDRHLRVVYHPEPQPERTGDDWTPEQLAEYWAAAELNNHGVHKVERLAGNVGYLDLRAIDEAEHTAPTLSAAMALLAHTSALLLDLRLNHGGAPSGVAFLCSYFVGAEPVHLNDVYSREPDSTQQFWSLPYLPAPRYLDRPVYVLTSDETFSGGEEIAYNLQQLGRATLVGETTRGGAHPTGDFWVAPHISVRIPTARSINPISKTNWEGVGVRPDIAVPRAEAFPKAYRLALEAILDRLGPQPERPARAVRDEATEALAQLPT